MNHLAANTSNALAIGEVFNTAVGDQTTLNEMVGVLKNLLSQFDQNIRNTTISYGPARVGDIPHSLASIYKAQQLLGYQPSHSLLPGLQAAIEWYWTHLQQ
jgi:UDP-N-acetylglucosamine 4-epimerase